MELDDLTPAQWEALVRAVFPPEPADDRLGGFVAPPLGSTEPTKPTRRHRRVAGAEMWSALLLVQ